MTFYAQNGEDEYLFANWSRLGLPDIGYFVEVGVGDGVRISNTKWLEDRGWNGLLIEPDPRNHASIIANRRAPLFACAVGDHDRPFVEHVDPEYSGFLRAEGDSIGVPVFRLTDILDANNVTGIDVLSIDTEGTEIEVWNTLDVARFKPRIVFVEWLTDGIGENADGIRERWERDEYRLEAMLGCNMVFSLGVP